MRSGLKVSRRTLILWAAPLARAGLSGPLAEALELRLALDRLKVATPRFRFVTGKPLERLRAGAPVPFAIQLSLFTDRSQPPAARDIQRFVFSYDLWEEKFAITRLGPSRRAASHLSAEAAEAWCVEEMALDFSGVSEQQPFWVRLEVRAEESSTGSHSAEDPMSLARLIELFSRRSRGEEKHWRIEAGPFKLADLRHSAAPRGAAAPGSRTVL